MKVLRSTLNDKQGWGRVSDPDVGITTNCLLYRNTLSAPSGHLPQWGRLAIRAKRYQNSAALLIVMRRTTISHF